MSKAAKPPAPKPVGRPKTRPPGAKLRGYWASDAEYAKLQRDAEKSELSVQELVRRRALQLTSND